MATTLNLDFATIRSAGAAAAAVAEELLETHGQMYSVNRHHSDSLPSSIQSSPAVSTRQMTASAFAAHHNFSMLDPKSTAADAPPDDPEYESHMLTLAQVADKSSKRRAVNLVIVDRGCDLVSPLLTQGTYEGLLDEAIGLHNNIIDLPISSIISEDAMELLRSKSNTPATTVAARKRLRADIDPVFGQLRDLSFSAAFSQIGTVANSLQQYYDSRPNRETSEMGKLQTWMQGLQGATSDHSLAAIHTALGYEVAARTFNSYEFRQRFEMEREMIEDGNATPRGTYVTDAIARGESLTHVLRLCCLWSATTSGIDSDDFDFVRKEILAIFGLRVMPLLANLERAGLLVRSLREPPRNNLGWIFPNFGGGHTERYIPSETGSTTGSVRSFTTTASDESRRSRSRSAEYSWQFARRALQLITELDQDRPANPGTRAAVAAAYSGYTPLSVRLVEAGLCEEGWGSLPHILSHMSLLPPGHATLEHRREEIRRDEDGIDAVIVFVGGITRAEATAVRMASKVSGMKALIATTAVMGPDEFVLSLDDTLVASG
ncbi:vacuolar protein sorting protein [Gracilaria domingensis]|nr:vacuolar protein sorting protein [Gracilaria domingensis]